MEKTVSLLQELITLRTDGDGERQIADFIEGLFAGTAATTRRFVHSDTRHSLQVCIPGRDHSRSVALVGHIDTVPVSDGPLWQHPPFSGHYDGEFVWGRGSADMKGGDTAMILVGQHLLAASEPPALDVELLFTCDEETSGMGVVAMQQAGVFDRAVAAFICEPTSCQPGVCEKGALWLQVTAQGVSSHGSRPDLGVSAIDGISAFAQRLAGALSAGAAHPLLGRTTMAMTTFSGGVKTNVIPDSATATFDIRAVPGLQNRQIIEMSGQIARSLCLERPGLHLSAAVQNDRPAIELPADSSFGSIVDDACRRCGVDPVHRGLYFYSDGSQFVPQTGVPFVILGPGDDAICHCRDEKIDPREIETAKNIYLAAISQL